MRRYNTSCQSCGGLIMEPGVAYGYAGPVCHCGWRPSMNEPGSSRDAEIADLRRRLQRLEDQQRREDGVSWQQSLADRREWAERQQAESRGLC
jgi:hypothetical protein